MVFQHSSLHQGTCLSTSVLGSSQMWVTAHGLACRTPSSFFGITVASWSWVPRLLGVVPLKTLRAFLRMIDSFQTYWILAPVSSPHSRIAWPQSPVPISPWECGGLCQALVRCHTALLGSINGTLLPEAFCLLDFRGTPLSSSPRPPPVALLLTCVALTPKIEVPWAYATNLSSLYPHTQALRDLTQTQGLYSISRLKIPTFIYPVQTSSLSSRPINPVAHLVAWMSSRYLKCDINMSRSGTSSKFLVLSPSIVW